MISVGVALAFCGVLVPRVACASPPAESDAPKADPEARQSKQASDERTKPQGAAKTKPEFTIVPVVGGSSDVGIGGGYVASYARVSPNVDPFVWKLESAGALTAKFHDGVSLGYFDDYLLFVVPDAFRKRLRFEGRVSYTIEPRIYYYGLGNASAVEAGRSNDDDYYAFERWHLSARAGIRYVLPSRLFVLSGLAYTHSIVHYGAHTALARDVASSDPAVASILHVNERENLASFAFGFGIDTRDDEVSAKRGQFHTLRADLAPGGTPEFPNRWARFDADLRGYVPLVRDRLTLAVRGVFDALTGEPAFSELSRFGEQYAVGGVFGVRGVPAGRYQGKYKVFGNVELRSELLAFRAFDKRNVLGVTAFFDGGRVFSDFPLTPSLDGTSLGLKYGVGGGLRLAAGKSFVLRGDVAWSPDASPVGAYLVAGQMF